MLKRTNNNKPRKPSSGGGRKAFGGYMREMW